MPIVQNTVTEYIVPEDEFLLALGISKDETIQLVQRQESMPDVPDGKPVLLIRTIKGRIPVKAQNAGGYQPRRS